MKCKRTGFTIIELLAVLAIIALLIGLLIPSMAAVRRMAKKTAQKAQLTSIDMAIEAFRRDYGDYPPSDWGQGMPPPNMNYSGAQQLAEALLGWDLLGFQPMSAATSWVPNFRAAGGAYNPTYLDERKDRYLELGTANAFRLGDDPATLWPDGVFNDPTITGLAPYPFVLCDIFGVRKIILADGRVVKAGTPILYYRANTSRMIMDPTVVANIDQLRYNAYDNSFLVALGSVTKDGMPGDPHPLGNPVENLYLFDYEGGIADPKINIPWPYRPDSYILISAGADGLYGTRDDITNFGN